MLSKVRVSQTASTEEFLRNAFLNDVSVKSDEGECQALRGKVKKNPAAAWVVKMLTSLLDFDAAHPNTSFLFLNRVPITFLVDR